MHHLISFFARSEKGATAIEYALIAVLVSIAIVTAATTTGTQVGALFGRVSSSL